MMKKICMISFVLHFAAAGSGCASGNDKKAAEAAPAKVYMTRDISPAGMKAVYEALGRKAEGKKVAVKLSTGEPGGNNFLQPALIGDLVKSVKGTIVECNTAYGGGRAKTEDHLKAAADHGFTAIAPVDIMDAEGEVRLPVEGGRHLKYDIVGSHFPEYDFVVVLSHFKGHAMGGFGGAIKNISIGIASSAGKAWIHSAGKTEDTEKLWSSLPAQDDFLESMAEAAKAIAAHCGERILYISVMNNPLGGLRLRRASRTAPHGRHRHPRLAGPRGAGPGVRRPGVRLARRGQGPSDRTHGVAPRHPHARTRRGHRHRQPAVRVGRSGQIAEAARPVEDIPVPWG